MFAKPPIHAIIMKPVTMIVTTAPPTQRKKVASVAAIRGKRTGGGSVSAAGRSATCAKNIPPTQITVPSRCSQSATRIEFPHQEGNLAILSGEPDRVRQAALPRRHGAPDGV